MLLGEILIETTESISITDLAQKVKDMCHSKHPTLRYMRYEDAFEEGFEDMMHR